MTDLFEDDEIGDIEEGGIEDGGTEEGGTEEGGTEEPIEPEETEVISLGVEVEEYIGKDKYFVDSTVDSVGFISRLKAVAGETLSETVEGEELKKPTADFSDNNKPAYNSTPLMGLFNKIEKLHKAEEPTAE
ncbi:MAG: hypothetical protein M0R03_16200 [Novosphingobium sp.]|nr:hypothetical protein [Novosphingobium sp.]